MYSKKRNISNITRVTSSTTEQQQKARTFNCKLYHPISLSYKRDHYIIAYLMYVHDFNSTNTTYTVYR